MHGLVRWTDRRQRRKHLRRLVRRGRHRLPWLLMAAIWLVPAGQVWTFHFLMLNPVGQLTVEGREGEPFSRTAVVLVPEPDERTPLDDYAVWFRNLEAEPVLESFDAARWLWVDPDGGFHSYITARRKPYRVLVHREGCEPAPAGRWQSGLWRRRIEITVPPCAPEP